MSPLMSEKMANNNELEHKRLVETYLNNNVKSNSKIISRADLIKIKDYLETGNSSQLEYNLKRRITTNKFFLLSLSGDNSGTKTVCVGGKHSKVWLSEFLQSFLGTLGSLTAANLIFYLFPPTSLLFHLSPPRLLSFGILRS